jgi:hypothetical protein
MTRLNAVRDHHLYILSIKALNQYEIAGAGTIRALDFHHMRPGYLLLLLATPVLYR